MIEIKQLNLLKIIRLKKHLKNLKKRLKRMRNFLKSMILV